MGNSYIHIKHSSICLLWIHMFTTSSSQSYMGKQSKARPYTPFKNKPNIYNEVLAHMIPQVRRKRGCRHPLHFFSSPSLSFLSLLLPSLSPSCSYPNLSFPTPRLHFCTVTNTTFGMLTRDIILHVNKQSSSH